MIESPSKYHGLSPLESQIVEHEDIKLFPYDDYNGKRVGKGYKTSWRGNLTVGVGINLEAGLTREESIILLRMRIDRIKVKLRHVLSFFDDLSENRQHVLIGMSYNLGITGLLGFKNMVKSIEVGDYNKAAEEMKDSLWYRQVKIRGKHLVQQMKLG